MELFFPNGTNVSTPVLQTTKTGPRLSEPHLEISIGNLRADRAPLTVFSSAALARLSNRFTARPVEK